MTETTKCNVSHQCPYCDTLYECELDDCQLGFSASCNDCYDKGLVE